MQAVSLAQSLNGKSLASFRALFASLRAPASPAGAYRGEFVGPGWLRGFAPGALALGGLAGWWGKEFDGQGHATNIICRQGSLQRVLPMIVMQDLSRIDGRPGISLHYPSGSPVPWPWVVDELRWLDERTLLGLTRADPGWFPSIAFPFLLHAVSG